MTDHQKDVLAYLNIANKVFEGTKYVASQADIQRLAENMALLEKRGLGELNRRLIDSGRNIWDTFSEHNFAVILLSQLDEKIAVNYEPKEESRRPIDFKITTQEITYWVQMKKLSRLERENRQNKIVYKIKKAAKNIPIPMFFGCYLAEEFSENDIPEFVDFIARQAERFIEDREYSFPNNKDVKAKVTFWHSNKSEISFLTLDISGDMEIVETTGLAKHQIKDSLKNAAGAFEWNVDQHSINLVAMDADSQEDLDICDAIFGTEFEIFNGDRHTWSRKTDGFFDLLDFSSKVAGVIAMKRRERKPVSDYFFMLFVNEKFRDRLNHLNNLLLFDKVIYFNMRPPMGQGNFDWA